MNAGCGLALTFRTPPMPTQDSHEFLTQLDTKLWATADKLRSNLDAAVYKHAVLGLIFLKYVSDSFTARRQAIEAQLRDPEHDFHLPREDFDSDEAYDQAIHQELEDRDYYASANVFWVPPLARPAKRWGWSANCMRLKRRSRTLRTISDAPRGKRRPGRSSTPSSTGAPISKPKRCHAAPWAKR